MRLSAEHAVRATGCVMVALLLARGCCCCAAPTVTSRRVTAAYAQLNRGVIWGS